MKSYVITIFDNPRSVEVAERCIASGKKFGIEIDKFNAFTPKSNPKAIAESQSIPTQLFNEHYSRFDNCLAAFLSHYCLWKTCLDINEEVTIFEHDAVITAPIPDVHFKGLISFGHPSYGIWKTPNLLGVNQLISKQYLPGAHAYRVNPKGAKALVDYAKQGAAPTDIYLRLSNFPWLQEYYPWPVIADDTFTTIQSEHGCYAKHNYKKGIEII